MLPSSFSLASFFPSSCTRALSTWIHCEAPSLVRMSFIKKGLKMHKITPCTKKKKKNILKILRCCLAHCCPGQTIVLYNVLMLQISGRLIDGTTGTLDFWRADSCPPSCSSVSSVTWMWTEGKLSMWKAIAFPKPSKHFLPSQSISEQSEWHCCSRARVIWYWRWCLGNWARGSQGRMEWSEALGDEHSRRRGSEWLWNGDLELWGNGPCSEVSRRVITYPEYWVTCWQCV